MKVTINGAILEKIIKDKDGEFKYFVRLYQKGVRENLDVNVKQKTYEQLKEGQEAEMKDIQIGAYKYKENIVLYAKEE
jgi:hypothetical protein